MVDDLESRVRKTGLWLYQLIEGETPSIFKKEYWTGKVMERCMKDEAFKVDYDFCKGCGTCVAECPEDAITMTGPKKRLR